MGILSGLSSGGGGGLGGLINIGTGGLYDDIFGISAAQDASKSQEKFAQMGIDEQRRQFDLNKSLQNPYTSAATGTTFDENGNIVNNGGGSFQAQLDILGLGGNGPQQAAISGIENSPMYQSMVQQGENAITSNASATGGLRGGNTQAALAQFRPQMLQQLLDQQYSRLGGITALGQNAAAGVGNAGMQTGANVANLLQQQGGYRAGGMMAGSQGLQNLINTGANIAGTASGMGMF